MRPERIPESFTLPDVEATLLGLERYAHSRATESKRHRVKLVLLLRRRLASRDGLRFVTISSARFPPARAGETTGKYSTAGVPSRWRRCGNRSWAAVRRSSPFACLRTAWHPKQQCLRNVSGLRGDPGRPWPRARCSCARRDTGLHPRATAHVGPSTALPFEAIRTRPATRRRQSWPAVCSPAATRYCFTLSRTA
jgi:hypothetical protein